MSDSFWPSRLLCPWGFSKQEYWSGLPCLPPGDLPHRGTEPRSSALQADSLPSEPPEKPLSLCDPIPHPSDFGKIILLWQFYISTLSRQRRENPERSHFAIHVLSKIICIVSIFQQKIKVLIFPPLRGNHY